MGLAGVRPAWLFAGALAEGAIALQGDTLLMVTAEAQERQKNHMVSLKAYCPFHLVELKDGRAGSALRLCSHVTVESHDRALYREEGCQ